MMSFAVKQAIILLGEKLKLTALLVGLVALLGSASPAQAHPHAWIDIRSTVILDDAGAVTGIAQEWLFDAYYTLFIIESIDQERDDLKTALVQLAADNLKNLRGHDYFAKALVDGQKIVLADVTDYDSALRENRLWMRFVIPFATPIDPVQTALSFSVYDPTYYIEILHQKDDAVGFSSTTEHGCDAFIHEPRPSLEAVSFAQSLDLTEDGGDQLGELFAERVEVTCQ